MNFKPSVNHQYESLVFPALWKTTTNVSQTTAVSGIFTLKLIADFEN